MCMCGIEYDKKEFKKHFRHCNKFLEKYKDFDLKISREISKQFKLENNGAIIIFFLKKYIKLINDRTKENKNYTSNQNPFYEIINGKSINNNGNPTFNLNNRNLSPKLNNKLNPDFCKNNCTTQQNNFYQKDVLSPRNTVSNYGELKLFQENNKIKSGLLKNSFKKIGEKKNNNLGNKIINPYNITFNLRYFGSKMNKNAINFIIDCCAKKIIENKGLINNQTTKYLTECFKTIFAGHWFIIISSIEYNDINYNFSSFINDKSVIFDLHNKKICVICYY